MYEHDIHIWAQLHDAVYVLCRHDERKDVAKEMYKIMIKPMEVNHRTMTIDADFSIGDCWGEMEDMEDW
jgi:hypothetical protein